MWAYIDQRNSAGNTQVAIEIGRQMSISKQAKSCFVWLSCLENARVLWLGDRTSGDYPGVSPAHLGLLLNEMDRNIENRRADTAYERLGLVQWEANEDLPSESLNNIPWKMHDRLVLR